MACTYFFLRTQEGYKYYERKKGNGTRKEKVRLYKPESGNEVGN
jgi:hypothetical protein